MRFLLIIQLPGDTSADLDTLLSLESQLEPVPDSSAEVDGRDLGACEGKIFVLTDFPADTFAHIQPLLRQNGLLDAARIAYRSLRGGEFTVLWPEGFSGQLVGA